MRPSPLTALACALLMLAGCATSSVSPAAATPAPSSAACATAPDPGRPTGWGQPAKKPSVVPVLINGTGELTCGPNRFLFTFIDSTTNVPVGAPNRTAKVSLFDLARDPSKATQSATGSFIWAIENERGVYAATVDFAEAGIWGAEFTTTAGGGSPETIRVTFQVQPSSSLVRVGQQAPATKTPTAADVGGDLTKISTDTKPDPALYNVSVADAIAKHQPFLVAFATPRFCQSAQCGPTLDRLKPFVAKYPTIAFIHVEPYQLELKNGALQPVLTGSPPNLTPADVTNRWGLLSEPWIFVVDRDGIVRGSFALIFGDAELTAALDSVK